jgi:hypothetical protein
MTVNDIHFVRVTTDDRTYRLWAAATLREQAVDRVLDTVPEGWTAFLMDPVPTSASSASLELAPGEVRELSNRNEGQPVWDQQAH